MKTVGGFGNQIGFYFNDIAKYREAEYFYLHGKTIAEDFYGKEHKNTATSYNNLALLYHSQGRYQGFPIKLENKVVNRYFLE